MPYRLSSGGALTLDASPFAGMYLRDGEGDGIMRRYFDGCYVIFLRLLERLRDVDRPFTAQEKREIVFMLQSLLREREAMDKRERR